MKHIAIQGILGSFHHQVAEEYYKNEHKNIIECMSFDRLADSLVTGESSQAIMAIENSIAGSIIPNYAIINDYNFSIIGEHYTSVEHHLLALENQKISDITEICSHPMALLQCKSFLKKYRHIKIIETADTAAEAKRISDKQLKKVATIASSKASQIYKLEKIAESIQTVKTNMTRFVILSKNRQDVQETHVNKASLRFTLSHKRGSLAAVLNIMSDCKLNLTKVQSLPLINMPWKYSFFVDVTFENYEDFAKTKSILEIMAEEFKVLGEYKNKRL